MDPLGYRCDGGLFLPGLHADAVRAARGVYRLLTADRTCPPDDAMAQAVWTCLSWMERHEPDEVLAACLRTAWNRYALATHERRLVASGKGTPAEVQAQLAEASK